jgi:hypothetical protein
VHYPAPAGSDTFLSELVDLSAGEADGSGRLRAVAALTLDFRPLRTCFRDARGLSTCLRTPLAKGPFWHVPPRRGSRPEEPKVSFLRESISEAAVGFAWRTR